VVAKKNSSTHLKRKIKKKCNNYVLGTRNFLYIKQDVVFSCQVFH